MGRLQLSIIIGTYNRLTLLQKCLAALGNGVHLDREIVVVDAGSTDGTLDFLQNFPGVRLIRDEALIGQAKSLNRVFKSLDTDYVCWLSDDEIVLDGALDQAVDILKDNRAIGMVALKMKDITGPFANEAYLGGIWESGVLTCNQGMLPTSLLRQLGGFDEDFRDYGIDIDLTTRVLLAGYKVVYTKQTAIHHYRDHETDNWITKSNREQRLQSARELYRSRYTMLISKDRLSSKPMSSRSAPFPSDPPSDSPSQGFQVLLYRFKKLVKRHKIIYDFVKYSRITLHTLVKYSRITLHTLVKYPRITLHTLNVLMNKDATGYPTSPFFRDLYNIRKGRFVSKWDLLKNYRNTYYLVQQIPITIREQMHGTGHPTDRHG